MGVLTSDLTRILWRKRPEADPAPGDAWGRLHEPPDSVEDHLELGVVLLLESLEPVPQFPVRGQGLSDPMKVRTMWMLAWIAMELLRTLSSIRAPCSVNAYGRAGENLRRWRWLQFATTSAFSGEVKRNINPRGSGLGSIK